MLSLTHLCSVVAILIALLAPSICLAQAQVQNVRARVTSDLKVEVTYDLQGLGDRTATVKLLYSRGGGSFREAQRVEGDVGGNIEEGQGRQIVWDPEDEVGAVRGKIFSFKVEAQVTGLLPIAPGPPLIVDVSSARVTVNLPDILFAYSSTELTFDGRATVRQIADVLNGIASGRRVAVQGHTDSFEGDERETQALSEARAWAVARALIAEGVNESRISIKGYGKRYPIAPNSNPDGSDNPAGRAKNRKVEVVILLEGQKEHLAAVEKPKPPYLTSNVSIQDESGDNVLEGGGEKVTLQVTVRNERSREGKPTGVARGVKVTISPKRKVSGVTFPGSLDVGEILPGTEKTVTGTFTANPDVPEGRVAFRVDAVEANGFDADPKEVTFNVSPFYKPVLRIGQYRVDAGTNQQIDLGEEVALSLIVQNEGQGKADKVRAQLVIPSTDIRATDDTDKTVGDLSPGSQKEVQFYFAVTKRFTGQEIPLTVKFREDRAKVEASKEIALPVNAYLPPPERIVLDPKMKEQGPGTVSPKLPELQLVSDVDEYILKLSKPARADQTKWGVVIGIERYRKAPIVPFASNDALAMREYMRKLFGIPEENIFFRFDDGATLGEMRVIFEDRLPRQLASAKGGIVYVYFAGHGIASQDDGQPYLLPHDGDPESPKVGGYALSQLYDALRQLKANQVHLFLDACFSGGSRSGDTLLPTRTAVLRVEDPVLASRTLFVLAAAKGNQVSNGFQAQQHGLFTYYLLKGLMGEANRDEDKDKRVKAWELAEYVQEHVYRESRLLFGQQRDQEPVVKPEGLGDRREWVIR